MRVEIATAAHRDAVADLWTRTNLTTSYNDPHLDFDFALRGANSTVLVGLDGDAVVASVMVGHDGHRGWMYYVAVDPDTQGAGRGREMVEAAENWLRGQGIWKTQLLIRSTNLKVKGFYEHLGYKQSDVIVMTKEIAPGFGR